MRLSHNGSPLVSFLRNPARLPVRRELALKAEFPKANYGGDWVWFEGLKHCKTEKNTTAIIHQYNSQFESKSGR